MRIVSLGCVISVSSACLAIALLLSAAFAFRPKFYIRNHDHAERNIVIKIEWRGHDLYMSSYLAHADASLRSQGDYLLTPVELAAGAAGKDSLSYAYDSPVIDPEFVANPVVLLSEGDLGLFTLFKDSQSGTDGDLVGPFETYSRCGLWSSWMFHIKVSRINALGP